MLKNAFLVWNSILNKNKNCRADQWDKIGYWTEEEMKGGSEVGRWLIATMLDGIAFRGGFAKIQMIY